MAPTHCEMKHRVIFWPLNYLGDNSGHAGPKTNRGLRGRFSEHSAVLGKFYKLYRLFVILIHEQTCWFTVCVNGLQTSQTKIPGKIWHVSTELEFQQNTARNQRKAWNWWLKANGKHISRSDISVWNFGPPFRLLVNFLLRQTRIVLPLTSQPKCPEFIGKC